MLSSLKPIAIFLVGTTLLFFLGFVTFVSYVLLLKETCSGAPIDSIVVFSGGKGRIAASFALQQKLQCPLFITGVGDGVDQSVLETHFNEGKIADQLILGYEALDTKGNAMETAAWVRSHGLRHVCLLTSDYHMPRSFLELSRHSLDGTTFYKYPFYFEKSSISTLYTFFRLCFLEYCGCLRSWVKL